jgi:hypothetical protein
MGGVLEAAKLEGCALLDGAEVAEPAIDDGLNDEEAGEGDGGGVGVGVAGGEEDVDVDAALWGVAVVLEFEAMVMGIGGGGVVDSEGREAEGGALEVD